MKLLHWQWHWHWLSVVVGLGATSACSAGESREPAEGLYVGVIPYGSECPSGPGREPVLFQMDDDNQTNCSLDTGTLGESRWVTPDAQKYSLPEFCPPLREYTELPFCRVAVQESAFRPLTTDPERTEEFYAVLRFGARCPGGSVEVWKRIENEDDENRNVLTASAGAQLPNEIASEEPWRLGYTKLFFCLFRAAASAAETMDYFPDLGFPYAVFHDFEGDQPPWVLEKRWKYSDDSNNTGKRKNQYSADPTEDPVVEQFTRIIENPLMRGNPNTYFDMARVK